MASTAYAAVQRRAYMAEVFFMVCRLMAVVAVGTIITILLGIASNRIEV